MVARVPRHVSAVALAACALFSLSSCAKPPARETPRTPARVSRELSYTSATGNPALAVSEPVVSPQEPRFDKALTVRVRTRGPVAKVRLKLEGAEGLSRGDYFLKKEGDDEWAAVFIAPPPGTYPLTIILYDAAGKSWPVPRQKTALTTHGDGYVDPESLVRNYLLALPRDNPNIYRSLEILEIEETEPSDEGGAPPGSRVYRAVVIEERWQGPKARVIYTFVLGRQGASGSWYIRDVRSSQ